MGGSMLRIVLVALVVVAMTEANCMDRLREIENTPGSSVRVGGYRRIDNPENDAIVKDLVTKAVKQYNSKSNSMVMYKAGTKVVAYQQVVNGMNYCMEIPLESGGCKNNINSDVCQAKGSVTCVVKAFKEREADAATIDKEDGLSCQSA